jgi:heme A synthase
MFHRLLAGVLVIASALAVYVTATGAPARVRIAAQAGLVLVGTQAFLGYANVAWALPTVLREAHAANACVLYLVYVGALLLTAIDERAPAAVRLAHRRTAGVEAAR